MKNLMIALSLAFGLLLAVPALASAQTIPTPTPMVVTSTTAPSGGMGMYRTTGMPRTSYIVPGMMQKGGGRAMMVYGRAGFGAGRVLVAIAAVITMLLVWTVLILIIINMCWWMRNRKRMWQARMAKADSEKVS